MLFPGRSVHGIGMEEPLTVIGIARSGRVVDVRRLRPWGLIVMRQARWLLEQPAERPLPVRGDVLSIVHSCPDI